ncbi:hypothetical protein Tco_0657479 [Tanacetum coccineum]|uniref:Integrase, catalytic region, zinc finger, CCHC-type, peptidase aspartic, catalytic n=1 Tax=Tanacetum coccineum TaxID=301880 RepID=A0ABQ4XCV1_9ASTR
MTTLAEFMIIVGTDNHPSMLEKSLYDSWKSRMEFYMENMVNGRMILDSVQNGPLVCPTITEDDCTTRKKTYAEPSASEKLQANCDCKATNIVLQGLPLDVYAIFNHHKVAKEIWDIVKLLMQGTKLSLQEKECLAVLVFNQGDDLIAYLNKAMAFLIAVASSRYKGNATSYGGNNVGGQARNKDLDAYDFDRDDVLNAKTVLMTNLSNYGSDVISEVPHSDSYHNDMDNQSVHAMQDFEQTLVVDFSNNKIHKLSDEQGFWLQTLHPNTDQSATSPVKIEVPWELPKVSLVNTSLKKLKYHLGQFYAVVKKRITPDAITKGE